MRWFSFTKASTMDKSPNTSENRQVFVIGTQKSGTTWLRDCLAEFVSFSKLEWYYPNIFDAISKHVNTFGGHMPADKRKNIVNKLCTNAWEILNEGHLGEKSAYPCSNELGPLCSDIHPFVVRTMREHFPNANIVVIVRDPRAVFNSLRHYLEHFKAGWSQDIDPRVFAENWAQQNLQWVRDNPDAIVLYEDLKGDFRNTLGDVLVKMKIEHNEEDLVKIENAMYSVDKLRPRQPEIYRTGTTTEWRYKVEPDIARAIIEVAEPAMREIGYKQIT